LECFNAKGISTGSHDLSGLTALRDAGGFKEKTKTGLIKKDQAQKTLPYIYFKEAIHIADSEPAKHHNL
jgi:hypothetical protein